MEWVVMKPEKSPRAWPYAWWKTPCVLTLVSGPTAQPDPAGVTMRHVESADDMLAACRAALEEQWALSDGVGVHFPQTADAIEAFLASDVANQ